jgi:RHS repeat-associated protein
VAGCIGDETAYEWDVLNRLVRIDNTDGSTAAYRYDAHGRRIEKDVNGALTQLAAAESFFYHTDHLGSIRLVTDAAGAVANRYDYDAFGNWEDTSFETVTNPFGFTARERDAESGLMFYRARYYDPKIGRFISQDPIGFEAGDLNVYRYVNNQPLLNTDPLGLEVVYYYTESQSIANFAILFGFVKGIIAAAVIEARDYFKNVKTSGEQKVCQVGALGVGGVAEGLSIGLAVAAASDPKAASTALLGATLGLAFVGVAIDLMSLFC